MTVGMRALRSLAIATMTVLVIGCAPASAPAGSAPPATAGSGAASSGPTACDTTASITLADPKGGAGDSFDPARGSGPAGEGGRYTVYDPLIRNIQGSGPGTGLQPGLATAWKMSSPTVLDLTLRQGVTFHDGTPFNAAAVKATYDRNRALPNISALTKQVYDQMQSLAVVSDTNVQITLKSPNPAWVTNLTYHPWFILSPSSLKDNLDLTAVGTGLYKLTKFTPNVGIDLVRNDNYWDKAALACAPKEMHILKIGDAQAQLNGVISGQLQIAFLDANQVPQAKSAGLNIVSAPTAAVDGFYFNYKSAPAVKDIRVRQALQYAVDRDAIVKGILLGFGVATVQMFPPTDPAYNPAPEFQPAAYPYDPNKAKQLLADAGYPNGLTLKVSVLESTQFDRESLAMQSQMAKAGITFTIVPGTQTTDWANGKVDLRMVSGSGRVDRIEFMNQYFGTNALFNPSQEPPPADYQSGISKAQQLDLSDPERQKQEQRLSGIITSQGLAVFTVAAYTNAATHPCITGLNLSIVGATQILGVGWKAGCKK